MVRIGAIRTVHTTYEAALKTTTHPQTRYRKPYTATQHLMLLMMGLCTRTCRAKNTSIKLPSCIKLAFQFISGGLGNRKLTLQRDTETLHKALQCSVPTLQDRRNLRKSKSTISTILTAFLVSAKLSSTNLIRPKLSTKPSTPK